MSDTRPSNGSGLASALPEPHLVAQARGQRTGYEAHELRVARVERAHGRRLAGP